MTAVIAAAISMLVTTGAIRLVARRLARPPHLRANFRGNKVIATGGVALVPSLIVGAAVSVFAVSGLRDALVMAGTGVLVAGLGWIDDVYGDRHAGGLLGHAKALLSGTFTTGMLKAAGGAALGLLAAWLVGWRDVWAIPAGAVVALSANLANLFDLRPGRVIKIWLPLAIWSVLVLAPGPRVVIAATIGAVLLFVREEMREWLMLGDTGAGLLGAVLGVGAVTVVGHTGLLVALAVLTALTIASEVTSFSRVIAAVRPLRWLDELGRLAD